MSKWDLPKEPQFYKWESPITEIFKQAEENYHKQLNDKLEEQLMCEVNYQVGYAVDKNELIKALQYDRDQYDKGYKDGVRETFIAELEKIIDKIDFEEKWLINVKMENGFISIADIQIAMEGIRSFIEELKGENK